MSIERSTVTSTPRAERGVQAHVPANPARQRSTAADASPSFGALLGALSCEPGAESEVESVLPDTPLTQELPLAGAPVASGTALVTADTTQMLLPDPGLPAPVADAGATAAAARDALLAQSAVALAPSAASAGLPSAGIQVAGAVDTRARRDNAAASSRALGRADSLPESAANPFTAALAEPSTRFSAVPETATPDAGKNLLRANAALARRAEVQRQGEPALAQPAASRSDTAALAANAATLLLDGLGGASRNLASGRDPERKTFADVTGPSWLDSAAPASASAATPTYVLDAGVAAPEVALAEQVHYWVSKGVQSAELQLDAFGGGQVDVFVSVVGNEAQVEFRTDQPDARRLLQDAMPQLREMLEQEGMQLSGSFVGTSARQDSGPNSRQPGRAQGAGKVTAQVTATGAAAAADARASGRTLDVFV